MNFFQRQDWARRQTKILVGYFVLAVVVIVIAVNAVCFALAVKVDFIPLDFRLWLSEPSCWGVTAATILIIGVVSLFRVWQLRKGGGTAVAAWAGATPVNYNNPTIEVKRFINVADEIAIASGTPRPALYVLEDEDAINAFVAGYTSTDTVLVVTKGCLAQLNRDELQGVIGHEYSHVLNGDMRLNIHLMGVLAGILAIGKIGEIFLRSSPRRSYSRSSKKDGNGLAALGIGLLIVGYAGLFFGRLIKASISRQREYLADASAVQFTRNPDGISQALNKILHSSNEAYLQCKQAEDISHMCFGQPLKMMFGRLYATHPPLPERILAINPNFSFERPVTKKPVAPARAKKSPKAKPNPFGMGSAMAASLAQSVASTTSEDIDVAHHALDQFSEQLYDQVHTEAGAQAIIIALLSPVILSDKSRHIHQSLSVEVQSLLSNWLADEKLLAPESFFTTLDLAIPSLRSLRNDEKKHFIATCNKLVKLDSHISAKEYACIVMLNKSLLDNAANWAKSKYFSIKPVIGDVAQCIALLCFDDKMTAESREPTYRRAMKIFNSERIPNFPIQAPSMQAFHVSIKRLAQVAPILKESIFTAFADTVLADGEVTPNEYALLRSMSCVMDIPLPASVHT